MTTKPANWPVCDGRHKATGSASVRLPGALKEYSDGEQIEITVQRLLDPPADEITHMVTPQRVLHWAKLSNQVVASKPSEPESAK